jgi:hypothetical protein
MTHINLLTKLPADNRLEYLMQLIIFLKTHILSFNLRVLGTDLLIYRIYYIFNLTHSVTIFLHLKIRL